MGYKRKKNIKKGRFAVVFFSFDCVYIEKMTIIYARKRRRKKCTLRQIEKIKALSEDMLEYQAIDVHKAWQSMERRAKRKASMRMFSLFFTRAAAILVVPLLISSLIFFLFILYHR